MSNLLAGSFLVLEQETIETRRARKIHRVLGTRLGLYGLPKVGVANSDERGTNPPSRILPLELIVRYFVTGLVVKSLRTAMIVDRADDLQPKIRCQFEVVGGVKAA